MRSRSRAPSLAGAEEPTPEPTSVVVQAGATDDVPVHLRDDPFVRYMVDPPAEDVANLDALIEAGERYGEDHEQALADLLAKRHPLQTFTPAAG
jgi:hypothetical protein